MLDISNRLGMLTSAVILGCVSVTTAPVQAATVDVVIWMSADNHFELYTGDANSTNAYVMGGMNWAIAHSAALTLPAGSFLYAYAQDVGAPYAVGGYISQDNGATFVPIIPGNGWEAVVASTTIQAWPPTQAQIDALIASANAGNLWVPATAGTSWSGFGLPLIYGSSSRPPVGSIWHPNVQGSSSVLVRYQIIPEPASLAILGLGTLLCLGYRREQR